MNNRRAVVTGMGAVTPVGNNVKDTWENMKAGKCGIAPITLFDTSNYKAKLAAEVKGFDPSEYMDRNDTLRTDRYTQFAVAAAQQAVDESGIEGTVVPERFAVQFGTGIGGIGTFETEHTKLMEKGPRRVSPLFVPMMIANMAAGMIAIRHDCRGSSQPCVTACASGSNAIGEAMRMIRHGYADAVITGGAEAAVTPSAVAGFVNMQALSVSEDPNAASLPFDKRRGGFVIGEGAVALVLEEYPKGVIHDFTYPLAHIATAKYWQQAEDNGLHFTVAETGWAKASWGKIYGQWLIGSAVMVYDFDNFDPKQLTTVINRYGVTSFCAPPTVYRYLVRKGIPNMPTLKHASTAGEMLAPEVFRRFTELTGLPLCEGYGQTETTMLLGNLKDMTPVEGSMGIPSPFYNIELRSKNGEPTPIGEIGEVVIVPPENGKQVGVFCGYLNNEEQYNHVWRNGVYHTGDAAYMDENGLYWFHGRFDDIIKTGGFRVGPYEIENVLMEHPGVVECSVVGIPDALRGQAIKAVIVLSGDYSPSAELEKEIKDFCNSRLAEYKWIRIVEFVKEMPKTISGKILKTELRCENK